MKYFTKNIAFVPVWSSLLLLICLTQPLAAQKKISISKELRANSEEWPVKMKFQGFGKITGYFFGSYGVVTSKRKGQTTTGKSNFTATQSQSESELEFSFTLHNGHADTATVFASYYGKETASHSFELLTLGDVTISSGEDALTGDEKVFLVAINTTSDTGRWAMQVERYLEADGTYRTYGVLHRGSRQIDIRHVSSFKPGGGWSLKIPALGYEFVENDFPLGVVQYMGGGMGGQNKKFVWLHKEADREINLVLAAAMTALMEWELMLFSE